MKPIGEWWVVEWNGGASFEWHHLSDVVQRNGEAMLEGVAAHRSVVGVVPTMESAQTLARELKRMIAECRIGESRKAGTGGDGE